jgi:hypothetical protein
MFAWYIDRKEAFSVYLDSARVWPKPGLHPFIIIVCIVNLGISQSQGHETGERGYV